MNVQYIAGFFDGEGCVNFGHGRNHPVPRILIVNTNRNILELIRKEFGGDIQELKGLAHKASWKRSWMLRISWAAAINFLKKIEPYLIIKRRQAKTLILWSEMIAPGKGNYWSPDRKEASELCVSRMKWLNQKGSRPKGEDPIIAAARGE